MAKLVRVSAILLLISVALANAQNLEPPTKEYLPPRRPQQASAPAAAPQSQGAPAPPPNYGSSASQPPRNTYLPPVGAPRPQPPRPSPPPPQAPAPATNYGSAAATQEPPRNTYLPPRPGAAATTPQPQPQAPEGPSQAQLYYGTSDSDSAPAPASQSASTVSPVYGVPGQSSGEPLGASASVIQPVVRSQCPSNSTGYKQGSSGEPDLYSNKQLVMAFYQEVLGDKNFDATDKYLREDYINHNPNVGDGRDEFKRIISQFLASAPKIQIDFRRVSAEGDLVWVHTRATNFGPKPLAVVDIFRVECGQIAEHWDVMQPIDDHATMGPNPHPFF